MFDFRRFWREAWEAWRERGLGEHPQSVDPTRFKLEIHPSTTHDSLFVDFTITNDLDRAVYVQHLVATHPTYRSDAYVYARGSDGVLLYCGEPPLPGVMCMYMPGRPAAERLQPGARTAGRIVRPLPLREWTLGLSPAEHFPFRFSAEEEAQPVPTTPVSISRVRLVIEYHVESRRLEGRRFPDGPYYDVFGPKPFRVAAEATLDQPCVLLKRSDEFPRQDL